MYDILPFPNITATDTEEQVKQINNYLIQFKEELEFILTNIGEENLSDNLVKLLHSLRDNTQVSAEDEALQQVAQNIPTEYIVRGEQTSTSEESGGMNVFTFTNANGTTNTFEVRNGEKGDKPTIKLLIDFTTGNLKYTSS